MGPRRKVSRKFSGSSCQFKVSCPLSWKLATDHSGGALAPPLQEGAQLPAARGMAQFAQRLGFDLTNPLARDGKVLTDLFERVLAAVADAKPHLDDLLFAGGQRLQHRFGLLFQIEVDHGSGRRDRRAILDEIAK